jgi:hypothetical protein
MTSQLDLSDVFEPKPKFYSKNAIAIWTTILSPFLGCILFSYNLKAVGKGKFAILFIIVGIFWNLGFRKLTASFIPYPILQLLIANLMGSLLLTFYFWNKLLGDDTEYDARPVWKPVLIFVGICVLLLSFNFFSGSTH